MRKKVCILAISAMAICSVPVSANTHTISTTQKVLEHSSENQIVDDGVFGRCSTKPGLYCLANL